MPRLEQIVAAELPAAAASHDPECRLNPGFRLWLTSAPTDVVPVSVLQAAPRVALEPPRGLRAQALRALGGLPAQCLSACDAAGRGPQWRRLLLSGVLLHAVLQERRRYGPIGWNCPYAFSDGDLACALSTLQTFLTDGAAGPAFAPASAGGGMQPLPSPGGGRGGGGGDLLPWEGLRYVAGAIHYGGRVTNDDDRRLLLALVSRHLSPAALAPPPSALAPGLPLPGPDGGAVALEEHVRALPADDDPRAFGLGPNAASALLTSDARRVLDAVLSLGPGIAGIAAPATADAAAAAAGGGDRSRSRKQRDGPPQVHAAPGEAALAARIGELAAALPAPLRLADASPLRDPFGPLACGAANSLGTVLKQEVTRWVCPPCRPTPWIARLLVCGLCQREDVDSAHNIPKPHSRQNAASIPSWTWCRAPWRRWGAR
jgi:hypothetical protein